MAIATNIPRERYVRSGPGQPLAPEHRDKPGASSYQQSIPENKGGDVKRAGASARTSEHDRPISYQPDTMVPALGVVGGTPGWAVRRIISRRSPTASHASHSFAVLAIFVHIKNLGTGITLY